MGESRRPPRCTQAKVTARFCGETSLPFCFVLPGSKSSLVYIIFQISTKILAIKTPANMLHVGMPLFCMHFTKLTWHFHWGITYVLFTLGNRWTSCYASHVTYAAFLGKTCVMLTLENRYASCYTTNPSYVTCQSYLSVNIQQWNLFTRSYMVSSILIQC